MKNNNPFIGKDQIMGNHATLWWDDEEVFEVESFEAKVTIDRESVTFVGSLDEDSKIKGMKGEGKFKIKHVYNRGLRKLLEAFKKGEDVRSKLITKLQDPDTKGGQAERIAINNCWFNELTLGEFEIGKKLEREFSFGFTVGSAEIIDEITM